MSERIERVVVVGTGQMGSGVALVTALAGYHTTMVGRSANSLANGQRRFDAALDFLLEHDAVTASEATQARSLLTQSTSLDKTSGPHLVIECIVEDLPTKQHLFREMDQSLGYDTILASSTSGLRISDIAALMSRPERAVTTHFWNPAYLMPLVEVIQGEHTSDDTIERTRAFVESCGKQPIVGRKDLPGQVCNRLFQAVIREAIYMVQEGIASSADVDTAIKAGMGLRFPVYGPLEHLDAVGLDLALSVQSSVLPSLCNSTEPSQMLKDMVDARRLGISTGRGFHDWERRSAEDLFAKRDLFLVDRLKASRLTGREVD